MKIKWIMTFCAIFGGYSETSAQTAVPQSIRANSVLTRFSQPNFKLTTDNSIMIFPTAREPEIEGDFYWDAHWGLTTLLLYEQEKLVENYLTRYDIYKDEFEFQLSNGIKVLPGKKVKNIAWMDSLNKQHRYLVNGKEYRLDRVPLAGFLEVLVDGSHSLFKKIRLEILKPNFNPALNVGKKSTRILKKETYYFNINNELYRIKSSKSMEPLFDNKKKEMELFIKKEGVSFKKEDDLEKIFNHFLSLK